MGLRIQSKPLQRLEVQLRYRQHAVVSRTNTLMETRTQANTLQRFGLGLRLASQTQAISRKR